jgi:hypothetical protein
MEHAYYLIIRTAVSIMSAVLDKLINWRFVADNDA